jgi:hypothetical protein
MACYPDYPDKHAAAAGQPGIPSSRAAWAERRARPAGGSPLRPAPAAARDMAERALSVRVLGFGCGADYLEGPVSATPPDNPPQLAPPHVRARSRSRHQHVVVRGGCAGMRGVQLPCARGLV